MPANTLLKLLENDNIPSPPAVALRLIELVGDNESSVDDIGRVISADPKLAARIIDFTNSPVTGVGKEVSSLQQAVVLLGLRTLRLLSLSFSLVETKKDGPFDYSAFWRKSMVNAISAKTIPDSTSGDEDFLLGLVFNIGAIAIGTSHPELLVEFDKVSCMKTRSEKEIAKFGVTRYQIGAGLLKKWNFPDHMIAKIERYAGRDDRESYNFYLAQLVGRLLVAEDIDPTDIKFARGECNTLLGMDDEVFTSWYNEIGSEFQVIEELFDTKGFSYYSIDDLEQRAKDSIFKISMGLEHELKKVSEEKQELENTAITDPLTGLKNRAAYDKELGAAAEYHKRRSLPYALLVLDIDHFKSVNDTYGHAAGDQVLKTVAEKLSEISRKYDSVYRFGGEEFVAIIADCKFEDAVRVAERFRASIQDIDFEHVLCSERRDVTVSIGGTWIQNGVGDSKSIFEQADGLLYEAKRGGRNRVEVKAFDENTCKPPMLGQLPSSDARVPTAE